MSILSSTSQLLQRHTRQWRASRKTEADPKANVEYVASLLIARARLLRAKAAVHRQQYQQSRNFELRLRAIANRHDASFLYQQAFHLCRTMGKGHGLLQGRAPLDPQRATRRAA